MTLSWPEVTGVGEPFLVTVEQDGHAQVSGLLLEQQQTLRLPR